MSLRVTVVYKGLGEHPTGNENTYDIEIHPDGRLANPNNLFGFNGYREEWEGSWEVPCCMQLHQTYKGIQGVQKLYWGPMYVVRLEGKPGAIEALKSNSAWKMEL